MIQYLSEKYEDFWYGIREPELREIGDSFRVNL